MLVEQFKSKYTTASRYEKAKAIAEVVRIWRSQSPPGRFLIVTDPSMGDSSKWHDVGDNAASKKVAQCLRERTPRADYAVGQMPPTAATAAAPADAVPSSMAAVPVPAVPTSAAAVAPPFTGSVPHAVEWQRRHQKQKQRKQTEAHQQQHPKHQGQRKKQAKNALKKQMQKQVELAEQGVWQAQQQVNQQAQELQQALVQRAQQEAATAAAAQVLMNQMALQQVEQEIWKEQNLMNHNFQFQQQQDQQLLQQPQPTFPTTTQPQATPLPPPIKCEMQDATHVAQQETSSDYTSSLDSPVMWEKTQQGSAEGDCGPRDMIASAMPSAARLTKNVFDEAGSSDSSTSNRMLYPKLDSFWDTSSESGCSEYDCSEYGTTSEYGATSEYGTSTGSDDCDISGGSTRPESCPPD